MRKAAPLGSAHSSFHTPIVAVKTSKSPRFSGTLGTTNLVSEKLICSLLLEDKAAWSPGREKKDKKNKALLPTVGVFSVSLPLSHLGDHFPHHIPRGRDPRGTDSHPDSPPQKRPRKCRRSVTAEADIHWEKEEKV